jgi:hypothetical protein
MWIYRQKSGVLANGDRPVASGYSGFHEGKNNPALQDKAGLGPLPQGAYWIGEEFDAEEHGPVAIHLIPVPHSQMFGRSGFLIHGDSASHPGEASHGCIILPRPIREQIAASTDRLLVVISGN